MHARSNRIEIVPSMPDGFPANQIAVVSKNEDTSRPERFGHSFALLLFDRAIVGVEVCDALIKVAGGLTRSIVKNKV